MLRPTQGLLIAICYLLLGLDITLTVARADIVENTFELGRQISTKATFKWEIEENFFA